MHPVITQAVAAERIREMRTHAAATGRARQFRRSRRRPPLPPILSAFADLWPLRTMLRADDAV